MSQLEQALLRAIEIGRISAETMALAAHEVRTEAHLERSYAESKAAVSAYAAPRAWRVAYYWRAIRQLDYALDAERIWGGDFEAAAVGRAAAHALIAAHLLMEHP